MDKAEIRKRQAEIIRLTREFCDEHLDGEIARLAKEMVQTMGRKREVPFERGKVEIWAAAVIHALAVCNFLFDHSCTPYTTNAEINRFFGTNPSTVTGKSKLVREMLDMEPMFGNFVSKRMQTMNPFRNCVIIDGMVIPLSVFRRKDREE